MVGRIGSDALFLGIYIYILKETKPQTILYDGIFTRDFTKEHKFGQHQTLLVLSSHN